MQYSILGDICPARLVELSDRGVVSHDLKSHLAGRFVVANLEAPIAREVDDSLDHLVFQGRPEFMEHLQFVSAFSLSNNHINDLGDAGMQSTVDYLDGYKFLHGGLFSDRFEPLNAGAVDFIFASDMMNIPFPSESRFKYLYMYSDELLESIDSAREKGRFVVLYLHTGLLFCRLPSPMIRERVYQLIDLGVDLVITAHSHCFGAIERYKEKVICYNLGDFLMDGQSMRRRTSMIFDFSLSESRDCQSKIIDYAVKFCRNDDYHVSETKGLNKIICLLVFKWNSLLLKLPSGFYKAVFNFIYRVNLASHVVSTLSFLVRSRGVKGTYRQLVKRKDEVLRYFSWVKKDRRDTSTDYDAIENNRKKITTKDIS
ncbi:CapA family protein [Pseudohongiella sp. O18]|uniref:CapA family protein n=1 Tax=Pseudohongiella sp. O18 TaxID=2904248 RepID=UPI001F1AE2B0|nr:CapA family protein [Pseudohongiella sp. O18]